MSKWLKIILIVLAFLLVSVGFFLYSFAGLRHYLKSLGIIYQSPTAEIKTSSWSQFVGFDPQVGYGGILAGSINYRTSSRGYKRVFAQGESGKIHS